MHRIKISGIILMVVLSACSKEQSFDIYSPGGDIHVRVITGTEGIFYSAEKGGKQVLLDSKLGLMFKNMEPLDRNFRVLSVADTAYSQTWEQPWGERRFIEENYRQLRLKLEEIKSPRRKMDLVFRVFNDGFGFRYEIPEQDGVDSIIISEEETEFRLPYVCKAWWIPAYKEKYYESLYRNTAISEMDTACVPVTIEINDSLYIAIHEADLTDYAAMNLFPGDTSTLVCDLTPWSTGEKVRTDAPMQSPWRTVIIAEKPGDLITSYLVLNLNGPPQITDCSWIKPGKYIGIWWGMHMNKFTWSQGPKHGATTENAIRYIDFAANNNFDGVLIEGWNYGWDNDWTKEGDKFSFTEPYPDFDIVAITRHAASRNVAIIGHHETGGATINYENQLDSSFSFYKKHGISIVKTGYVSPLLDNKEYHSSQYGVRHYRKVIETAARRGS